MIGYYAHQHGSGHCKFAEKFSSVLKDQLAIFTSYDYAFSGESKCIKLPDENPDGTVFKTNQVAVPDYLHYSPVGQSSIQQRSLQLLQAVVAMNIELLIIDVSAEIAALARASSIPYAYVRLPGERNDPAHLQAFKGAVFVLAYFPESFETESTPRWLKEKTVYLGFLSGRKFSHNMPGQKENIEKISVVSGNGGNEQLQKYIPQLQERFSGAQIDLLGSYDKHLDEENLHYKGFVRDLEQEVSGSDLLVGNCGLNTVSEFIQLKIPFVAIPEDRPFKEQFFMAQALYSRKLALEPERLQLLTDREIMEHTNYIPQEESANALSVLHDLLQKHRKSLPEIPRIFRQKNKTRRYEHQR